MACFMWHEICLFIKYTVMVCLKSYYMGFLNTAYPSQITLGRNKNESISKI